MDGATPAAPAIAVRQLSKSFGELEAVRGVSFEVASGEVFGFLGPNGAGKTTTINVLCTLAKPSSGTALVAGYDVVRERDDVRRHIGLVFQDPTLDGYLSAEQNLRLHAELYGVRCSRWSGSGSARTGPCRRSPAACGGDWRSRAA
jgi:ABC-2 type transport system ATP-binding protein